MKKVYFTHRQVCVCEATYRLIPGLNLKGSNVKTKFIATGLPENRSTFLRRINDDEEANNEDSDQEIEQYEENSETPLKNVFENL